MSDGWVGSWPTRILLVVAAALLSIWSISATPSPVLAGQGTVRYVYDGPKAEPKAAAVQRSAHGPDQKILGDRTASAALSRGYDHRQHLAGAPARSGEYQGAPNTADVGLSTRGLRPAPGTRVRPEGVPEGWRIDGTRSAGGTRYYDPTKPGNSVRVMQGNPNSQYPTSQSPL